nr:RcpC/CpaB family pilus assembly protein [Streptomyces sp. DvalAA-19]
MRRMLRRRRRTLATGLALAGAALATTGGLGSAGSGVGAPEAATSDTASPSTGVSGMPVPGAAGSGAASATAVGAGHPSARLVSAPVRIADSATVRLLRPGDRVDVIAVGEAGDDARLVARDVRVARVPGGAADGGPASEDGGPASEGALVMLSVERSTATALLGAGAAGRLAVAVSDAN